MAWNCSSPLLASRFQIALDIVKQWHLESLRACFVHGQAALTWHLSDYDFESATKSLWHGHYLSQSAIYRMGYALKYACMPETTVEVRSLDGERIGNKVPSLLFCRREHDYKMRMWSDWTTTALYRWLQRGERLSLDSSVQS